MSSLFNKDGKLVVLKQEKMATDVWTVKSYTGQKNSSLDIGHICLPREWGGKKFRIILEEVKNEK